MVVRQKGWAVQRPGGREACCVLKPSCSGKRCVRWRGVGKRTVKRRQAPITDLFSCQMFSCRCGEALKEGSRESFWKDHWSYFTENEWLCKDYEQGAWFNCIVRDSKILN